jgi:hypothetical protein
MRSLTSMVTCFFECIFPQLAHGIPNISKIAPIVPLEKVIDDSAITSSYDISEREILYKIG